MRVIERNMVRAIKAGKDFRSGNTAVDVNEGGAWVVRLHGNAIATGTAAGFQFTLAGWNTPTTRSRINALLRELTPVGGRVYCKAFEPYYNGVAIGSREWVSAAVPA